jgi:hypothetical protein
MSLYYVKADGLWGVPRGTVERFLTTKGEALVASGELEHYDATNSTHRAAAERAGYATAASTAARPIDTSKHIRR